MIGMFIAGIVMVPTALVLCMVYAARELVAWAARLFQKGEEGRP